MSHFLRFQRCFILISTFCITVLLWQPIRRRSRQRVTSKCFKDDRTNVLRVACRTCRVLIARCCLCVKHCKAMLIISTRKTLILISCPSPTGRRYGNRGCSKNGTLTVRRWMMRNVDELDARQVDDVMSCQADLEFWRSRLDCVSWSKKEQWWWWWWCWW